MTIMKVTATAPKAVSIASGARRSGDGQRCVEVIEDLLHEVSRSLHARMAHQTGAVDGEREPHRRSRVATEKPHDGRCNTIDLLGSQHVGADITSPNQRLPYAS